MSQTFFLPALRKETLHNYTIKQAIRRRMHLPKTVNRATESTLMMEDTTLVSRFLLWIFTFFLFPIHQKITMEKRASRRDTIQKIAQTAINIHGALTGMEIVLEIRVRMSLTASPRKVKSTIRTSVMIAMTILNRMNGEYLALMFTPGHQSYVI